MDEGINYDRFKEHATLYEIMDSLEGTQVELATGQLRLLDLEDFSRTWKDGLNEEDTA